MFGIKAHTALAQKKTIKKDISFHVESTFT